ncbi:hypothetical protein CDO44_20300 [Pigmentiphaga sp. NML080357]|uniref:ABC-type transport auxiliary lipoprotein family protein n=1 Tax=Pigmentiphaga sp. NML080357 TaxID=2008675 RepID=UPI000B420846|nr:ABC-type transport auxiliary lipoprotein family protein [Pigmentiphaga sp. NML080357]OVZ56565.1 hypothetical protein CDO44_20300 [Pigmentiphaga sp. NML080357]
MTMTGLFLRGAGACVLALAASCSLLPEQKIVTVYRLPTSLAAAQAGTGADTGKSLRIRMPHASAVLESARIAVIVEGDQVSNYGGARWTDVPPALVRDKLAAAFRADGRMASVTTSDSNVRADLELDTDLRAFQSEYRGSAPYAVVGVNARLISPSTRRVLASRSFEAALPAEGVEVPAVVTAFGQASDAVAAEIVKWVVVQDTGGDAGR